MIILDIPGDTIQAESSAANGLTVTLYGLEKEGTENNYSKLSQQILTGSATKDTLYTLPANTTTAIVGVMIANTTAAPISVDIWHVPNGGSPSNSNILFTNMAIGPHKTFIWNKGKVSTVPEDGGAKTLTITRDENNYIESISWVVN